MGGGSGMQCFTNRVIDDEDRKPPIGWRDWLKDPTMHFMMQVNEKWLQQRRKILEYERPNWEKPPLEEDGTAATDDILLILEAALVVNAKSGGFGIAEEDLPSIRGLEDIKLPLGEPPEDSNVRRMRLPGKGTASQWTYALKAE